MIGVPYLLHSSVRATCDVCRAQFDPGVGGYCSSCSRLLCERHFHGGRWQRFLRSVRGVTLCRECAADARPAPRAD